MPKIFGSLIGKKQEKKEKKRLPAVIAMAFLDALSLSFDECNR